MAKNIKKLAKLFGAEIIGRVPDAGGGAFGAARPARIRAIRKARPIGKKGKPLKNG